MTKRKVPGVKSKTGPKPKPIDVDKAYELAREGADNPTIQKALGRAPNEGNFGALQRNNPDLKQAIKRGREENIQEHVKQVVPLAQWALKEILSNPDHPGFTAATIFVHKTQMGFRETTKHEVSGEVHHVHSLSPEDRAKRIQELRSQLESAIDVEIQPEVSDDSEGT